MTRVVMYLGALRELIDDGSILIAANDAEFITDDSHYIGVYHDTQLLLHPARAYERILTYYRRSGTAFPLGKERIHAALFEAGIIQGQSDGIRHGTPKISYAIRTSLPNRPRMLSIDLAKMAEILEV